MQNTRLYALLMDEANVDKSNEETCRRSIHDGGEADRWVNKGHTLRR
jgi:hypothetical protein